MDAERFRRASYEIWEANAPGWERWRAELADSLTPVRQWLIGALAPSPGDTVLELSAGTGDTGFAAARLLGPNGRLISTDFSPKMVQVPVVAVANSGLTMSSTGWWTQKGSTSTPTVWTACCARADTCSWRTRPKALAETRRVLRTDGRLAISVWGAPERNPWASIIARVLIEREHLPAPQPGAPGVFSMASEQRTRGLLEGAGFGNVRTDEVPVTFAYRSLDEYEQWIMDVGGPLATVTRRLPKEERDAVRAQLATKFEPFATDDGYAFPGTALCAVAS